MINLTNEDKMYFSDIWRKIDNKMKKVAVRSYDKIPYTAVNGVHDDKKESDISWWTNGFWPGMMWILYVGTEDEQYMKTAIHAQDMLREVLVSYPELLHHDAGFMWNISSGVNYRLTGDKKALNDELTAANSLSSRFNIKGNFIRAWNDEWNGHDVTGWAIIDCMMNLPLLYRAAEITGFERYSYVAKAHADKTMEHHVRDDGSVKHIVEYDPKTGEYVDDYGGQGYEKGSSWSRGQSWGLYGFTLSYIHTKDEKYLNVAKKIANYFIANLSNEKDFLPLCDFRAPKNPVIYDSTAGACAACGFIELASVVSEYEKQLYLNAAIKLLKAMTDKFVDFSEDTDPLLLYGTELYHSKDGKNIHIPIIYGDYFYIEAVYKLINEKKNDMLFW